MDQPLFKPEATHTDIQEILRMRREMLNRVRADLDRIGKPQEEFGRADAPREDPSNPDSAPP